MSTCLDDNGLADLFGGAADDARSTAIDAHVAGCEGCRRLVGTYARLFGESATDGDAGTVSAAAGAAALAIPLPGPTVLARAWAEAQVGRTVGGRWRLSRVVGLGGSAAVFEALHRNGSRVAIKLLRPEHLAIASLMGRFMREAYVANQIDHPGVVRVIDDGATEEGAPFLVMDLLEGQTLRERVEQNGTLAHDAAIDLCSAVLDVLAKAHERGVVHRDLKPDNLFFDASGAVRVLDFGIARLTSAEGAELTQTGLGMGTSAYMPPEQARGEWEAVGPRSDLWALAATTVFALGKRPPHVAANAQKTLLLAATTKAPSVVSMVPHVRAGLARALDHALAFDPERRPTDARAMAMEIAAARADSSAAAPDRDGRSGEAAARSLRKRRLAVTAAILCAGAMATATVARVWGSSPPIEPADVAPPAPAPVTPSSVDSVATADAEPISATPSADVTGRPAPRLAPRGARGPASVTAPAVNPQAAVAVEAPATSAPPAASTAGPGSPAPMESALFRRRH